jgi:hypothetical protein
MPGALDLQQPAGAPAPAQPGQRVVSPEDKALSADWLKRIEAALGRDETKQAHKTWARNRKLLRGRDPSNDDKKLRANLFFANLAVMKPQVYAKDPEFAIQPTRGVPEQQLEAVRGFCSTAEAVLGQVLVKDAKLKKRAKRLLTSAYTTAVGWWKLCWVEDRRTDPLVANQLKDSQDNLIRLQQQRAALDDPQQRSSVELQVAQLQQTMAGLQAQAEVVVSRGLALDFVLSEDVLVLDDSVRELTDYERAGAIAHRVWMTRAQYKARFGYECAKGRGYTEQAGAMQAQQAGQADRSSELLCVWEAWDQDSNRVFHVCEGEEGFCCPPSSPDWTGRRWFPFFLLAFNEVDGALYPISDIELTEPLVREYNEARDDFVHDRRECLPLNIARKGGSLTPNDLERIKNRRGGDLILVEGTGGQPISNDIWSGQLGQIRPENYDTSAARQDMEMLIGGGDAARGSVLKAKTATEAEIMAQGLRGRSAERTDTMEDLLSEVGEYALQVCLRKLTPQEVARIAGPEAEATWPTLSADEIFELVSVSVRGGSTGKPDRLQEQDRWTKLLPVIEKTASQVAELYAKGQGQLAQALVQLLRETLRRFDERVDIEQFLPPAPKEGQPDPAMAAQEAAMLKQKLQELENELSALREEHEKGLIQAAAQVATSAQPALAMVAFQQALQALGAAQNGGNPPGPPLDDPLTPQAPQGAPPIQ